MAVSTFLTDVTKNIKEKSNWHESLICYKGRSNHNMNNQKLLIENKIRSKNQR